jgi:hypothetical protein
MKKSTLLMMAMLLMTVGAWAEKTETVLWEGSYPEGGIEIANSTVSTFQAGDVMRIYAIVPESGGNFKICYKGESNGWSETTIPSIDNQWPWLNGGETYYDVTFTSDDIKALDGMNIYIYNNSSTISKVSLLVEKQEEPQPTVGEKIVWEGSEPISWNTEVAPGSQYETPEGTFTDLKKNDTIRIYTTTTYEEPQYVVTYKKGDGWEWTDLTITVANGVITYVVADETTATEIAERGIVMRGQAYTMTKITIASYKSSTGIMTTKAATTTPALYNLRGQKVDAAYKGLVIKNCRKYMMR